jgi:transcriptional regulator with XRE-family HTH domain
MSNHEFRAMLRFWRCNRGLSQFELALMAGVSARHVSFLETGRAKPSSGMLVRLLAPLALRLQDQHDIMKAAGFETGSISWEDEPHSIPVEWAIDRMMKQQEPFPLVVLSTHYSILRANVGAHQLFSLFLAGADGITDAPNFYSLIFDPRLVRPFIENWAEVAEQMLARLTRECTARPTDQRLQSLRKEIGQFAGLEKAWQHPNFKNKPEATLAIRLRRGSFVANFMTTLTVFSTPWKVAVEELRIESYFPLDEATTALCQSLAAQK